jgi:predicted P-loop ATPase
MLALEGPQGSLKSTMLRTLAVKPEWFLDDMPMNVDTKKLIEQVRGRWIIEASELKGMKAADLEHIKNMLSRTHDRSRLSYDRFVTDMPRDCVFFATTNDAKYLRDQTGNRRFWPVAITKIDIEALKRDRDQLWAEAVEAEATGESIRLSKKLWAEAGKEQEQRLEEEPWVEIFAEVLGRMQGKIRKRDVREIIGRPSGQFTAFDAKRLVYAMTKLGWKDGMLRFGSIPERCWWRGGSKKMLKAIKIAVNYEGLKRVVRAEYEDGPL